MSQRIRYTVDGRPSKNRAQLEERIRDMRQCAEGNQRYYEERLQEYNSLPPPPRVGSESAALSKKRESLRLDLALSKPMRNCPTKEYLGKLEAELHRRYLHPEQMRHMLSLSQHPRASNTLLGRLPPGLLRERIMPLAIDEAAIQSLRYE